MRDNEIEIEIQRDIEIDRDSVIRAEKKEWERAPNRQNELKRKRLKARINNEKEEERDRQRYR